MRLIKKWWWLIAIILAIALVIGWEEERCQTKEYECRASYAAQTLSERLPGDVSIYQRASTQQAITAACEPHGYLCRLFGATNLPSVLLVLIGIGGVWAAIRTLRAIEKQVDALIASERPWLLLVKENIGEPYLNPIETQPAGDLHLSYCNFSFKNYGRTPAKIVTEKAELQISNNPGKPNDLKIYEADYARDNPAIVPQGGIINARAGIAVLGYISSTEYAAINNKKAFLWLCGFIRYRDTFDRVGVVEYETRFCYLWDSNMENPRPEWRLAGPSEYNRAN
jgi:hypothetical protein